MADPLVIQVMRQFKADLLARETVQQQEMLRRWMQVDRSLEAQIELLAREIADMDSQPTRAQIMRLGRYRELLAQVRVEVMQYQDYAEREITGEQREYSELGIQHGAEAIEASYREAGIRPSFNRLNVNAVEYMAGLAGDGSPLFDVLQRRALWPEAVEGLTEALVQGTAQGWNPRKTARAMQDGLANGLQKALEIARTETMRAYRFASDEQYKASGVVSGKKRLAAHDTRTCFACLAADGELLTLDQPMYDHPMGRCTAVCVCAGAPEPTWQYGPQWFAGLPESRQRSMMGDKLFEAWQSGQVQFGQLVTRTDNPTWGQSLQVTPLRELLKPPEPPPVPPEQWPVVRSLGGSTGAELVQDPKTEKLYVRKFGKDAEHIRGEFAADQAYRALGANVPEAQLIETERGPMKLSEFIEGRSLADLRRTDPKAYKKAVKALQKDFAADALLGNWDVVGLAQDNILVDAEGQVWRIDNGGSLKWRAQGQLKSKWDRYPTELWTMRDMKVNAQSAEIFGDLGWKSITRQINAAGKQREALLAALPDDLRETVAGRLEEMQHVAKVSGKLFKDKWREGYTDGFSKQVMGLRSAGVIDKLPAELRARRGNDVMVYDERGRAFDSLRGQGSVVNHLFSYIQQAGGNTKTVEFYMGEQGGNSWNSNPQAAKWWLAQQRDVPLGAYYWRDGTTGAKAHYDAIVSKAGGEQAYATTWQAMHAFQYEFLSKTKFKNNNQRRQVVTVVRTEDEVVMRRYNLHVGDKGVTMPRGALESTSIFKPVVVTGHELTRQEVPYTRVFATYFLERTPGFGGCGLYGDSENEFVCMLEGIKFDYERSIYR